MLKKSFYHSCLDLIILISGEKEIHFPTRFILCSVCVCCFRAALSQSSDKCHLSGAFNTYAGVKADRVGVGREKSGVHTSLRIGDDPVTELLIHTHTDLKL